MSAEEDAQILTMARTFKPDPSVLYAYRFFDENDLEPSTCYVKLPYPPNAIVDCLIASLQFQFHNLAQKGPHSMFDMGYAELSTILTEFYGGVLFTNTPSDQISTMYELDVYDNWEAYASLADDILGIEAFQREGLSVRMNALIGQDYARELADEQHALILEEEE